MSSIKPSPFLTPGSHATPESLAILHLKRDLLIPITLQEHDTLNEGYEEGKVTNTRFGSFPHSTLIGLPWGTQVRASKVDTGSRGRKAASSSTSKKRKRKEDGTADSEGENLEEEEEAIVMKKKKAAVQAASGFVHILPPTPELWTTSLPHRTQVVYTPDYSYILHRIRARPGSVIIEAGAGSGSFSHAAARAVYSGVPNGQKEENLKMKKTRNKKRFGTVYSFEFHQQRVEKLKSEISEHGLDGLIHVTHRDVYNDGFLLDEEDARDAEAATGDEASRSPQADCIFLDLPAPW